MWTQPEKVFTEKWETLGIYKKETNSRREEYTMYRNDRRSVWKRPQRPENEK